MSRRAGDIMKNIGGTDSFAVFLLPTLFHITCDFLPISNNLCRVTYKN